MKKIFAVCMYIVAFAVVTWFVASYVNVLGNNLSSGTLASWNLFNLF